MVSFGKSNPCYDDDNSSLMKSVQACYVMSQKEDERREREEKEALKQMFCGTGRKMLNIPQLSTHGLHM